MPVPYLDVLVETLIVRRVPLSAWPYMHLSVMETRCYFLTHYSTHLSNQASPFTGVSVSFGFVILGLFNLYRILSPGLCPGGVLLRLGLRAYCPACTSCRPDAADRVQVMYAQALRHNLRHMTCSLRPMTCSAGGTRSIPAPAMQAPTVSITT